MFKGFYNLTSAMLSQNRRLDVISNNMANVSTVGYKSDKYTDSTFDEYIVSRIGNMDKSNRDEIGNASYILAPSKLYTDYSQGALEATGLTLDFAITGDGFFGIQGGDGVAYSRNGSFSLDNAGYLTLPNEGRVLGSNGQPVYLGTDKISVDGSGNIFGEDGNFLARLGVFTFADNGQLERNDRSLFVGAGATQSNDARISWKTVERSNIDLVQQMVDMISSQRSLQSASQVSKMYDQIMTKATNELGRL